jgi:F5/8 type C domain
MRPRRTWAAITVLMPSFIPKSGRFATFVAVVSLLLTSTPHAAFNQTNNAPQQARGTVTVSYTPGRPSNVFKPAESLGAGVDGHERGDTRRMLNPRNVREMLSAGLKPLTYRLRTELGGDAWHWNPAGSWSDARSSRGYWTSSSDAPSPINVSYGYRLPRRGNTTDQANDDGYSRLDDGDPRTFWKSNPYLDSSYTGEPDAAHPQWIAVDLGAKMPVNAIRLDWARPFATRFRVEYATSDDTLTDELTFNPQDNLTWHTFPRGEVEDGKGGDAVLRLADEPINIRHVRILLLESSHTAPAGSKDLRDRAGYAVREVGVGLLDAFGHFRDNVRHSATHAGQTLMHVSSTDPWHRASDLDTRIEQPGLDLIFRSGLTNNLPALVPVGIFYDTPENAVALVRFLKRRGYRADGIELGEEPDGQLVSPEDYGALYARWVRAMRPLDPSLRFGGPSFATITPFADEQFSEKTWLKRFLAYNDARGVPDAFNFFTFEWYPFDEVCAPAAPQLASNTRLLADALAGLRPEILPESTPVYITEYGYSSFAAEAEVNIEGALLNADTVGLFLTLGGERAYLYGYEPNEIISESACTWGNNMLFRVDERGRILFRTATYYGARLVTEVWAQPSDARMEVFPAASDIIDEQGQPLVTAYALRRPDGHWSLLIINKDPVKTFDVGLKILDRQTGDSNEPRLPADLYQYSRAQYLWHPERDLGHPLLDLPPAHTVIAPGASSSVSLPPYSLTVFREE